MILVKRKMYNVKMNELVRNVKKKKRMKRL